MKQLDANTLVAYVDGELDAESANFVEQALAEDAEATRTVDILRDTALLVRAAHNHVIHETVPERLIDTVMMTVETDRTMSDAVPQHLVNMILDAPEDEALAMPAIADKPSSPEVHAPAISLARRRSVAAVAMAATFAAFMLGGGFLLGQQSNPAMVGGAVNQTAVVAASDPYREAAFQEALETKKSDSALVWTNPDSGLSGAIIPVKTYKRDDGTFCRAFRTVEAGATPDKPNYGVACRQPGKDGRWVKTVEAVAGPGVTPKLSF